MKNLVVIVAFLIAGMAVAQPGGRQEKKEKKDINPEQVATMQSKKMTLELDLSDKQQKAVYDLVLTAAKDRKERPTREALEAMTPEQKNALKIQVLDKKIAHKRAMQSILNTQQYEKWESNAEEKRDKVKEKIGKRRGKKGDRE